MFTLISQRKQRKKENCGMVKPIKMMVEIEEIAFGRIFRMLDGTQGIVAITPIGDGPKGNGKTTGQKQGGAQSAPCIVLKALIRAGSPLPRANLGAALTAGGKSVSSLADTMNKLRTAKEVIRSGSGKNTTYKVTPKGIKRFETACTIQPVKE
jgi:hypothetical protein